MEFPYKKVKREETQFTIAMIILAAGESKRMGSIKQLLPWKHTTLLGNAIEQGMASDVNSVYVVLGANEKIISDNIKDYQVSCIENMKWSLGMGSSIAAAMDFFKNNSLHFDAVLIALSDQPLIDFIYFNKLIFNYINSNKKIIASQRKAGEGVPAIFDSIYFKDLLKLDRDYGARKIITGHKEDLYLIKTENKDVDIDTYDDYRILYKKYGLSI